MDPSDKTPAAGPPDLADTLAEVARVLLAEGGADEVVQRMSSLAVETIDGADHCGVTVIERGEVRTAGASDDVPRRVDRLQYESGEGPCLDAIREHQVFTTADLATEDRWPAFAPRAVEDTKVRSVLSFRLYSSGHTMGALNLYSEEVDGFTDEDRQVASLYAAHAAVALSNAQQVDNLEEALETRDIIATAKGMLMASGVGTEDEAFEVLRRASQRMNVKLRLVAERVVRREPMEGEG